jgi:hypothetical protein
MDNTSHNVRLTGPELANLWSQYMNDSLAICVIRYGIEKAQDKDVRAILEFALGLSQSHIEKIKPFLTKENYPIPQGFTKEEDVNLNALPLFSDTFMLVYMYVMTLHGLTGYAVAVGTSVRADQISYFIQCNSEAMELYGRLVNVMLHKGIFSRPPFINAPHDIDFVKKQSYLKGWFGNRRPLNGIEMSSIHFNMQKTVVKIVLEIGFSQVAQSKDVREYFQRGEKLCSKHFEVFGSILSEDNLPSPKKWDSEVSNSTVSPFSEKLMLNHIVILVSAAVGFYSAGLAVSQRRDLTALYTRLISEIGQYAEDGVNLLIKHGWMEQPPTADDRASLANQK